MQIFSSELSYSTKVLTCLKYEKKLIYFLTEIYIQWSKLLGPYVYVSYMYVIKAVCLLSLQSSMYIRP